MQNGGVTQLPDSVILCLKAMASPLTLHIQLSAVYEEPPQAGMSSSVITCLISQLKSSHVFDPKLPQEFPPSIRRR